MYYLQVQRKHFEVRERVTGDFFLRLSNVFFLFFSHRGMRTHIRMHIDKKSGDYNEENYISCILDDDSTEIPPAAAAGKTPSPEIREQQKINVIKHEKMVKSPDEDNSSQNGSESSVVSESK
jgi:hypothetical protein